MSRDQSISRRDSTMESAHISSSGKRIDADNYHSGEDLLLGTNSEQQPTFSVVVPTLNEEEGIAECIERIKDALEDLQVYGEVIVSDDSDDRTPEIAKAMGAIVVYPDEKGYGSAYKYAFEQARGNIIAMGDADTTYDFKELPGLYKLVATGEADLAVGSRLKGEIKDGAMPKLHRFVGNPLLTKLLNVIYDVRVSDAHSGMRVFSREAYEKMDVRSTGMEFASEMIMHAGEEDLAIRELPITYYNREGEATLESFRDGWRHVKFMLMNAPGYLFTGPGFSLIFASLIIIGGELLDIKIGKISLGVNAVIAGCLLFIVGIQTVSFSAFATAAGKPIRGTNDPLTTILVDRITVENGLTLSLIVILIGMIYAGYTTLRWVNSGPQSVVATETIIITYTACVIGIQMMFTSFLMSILNE